jgi:hypothetical protein
MNFFNFGGFNKNKIEIVKNTTEATFEDGNGWGIQDKALELKAEIVRKIEEAAATVSATIDTVADQISWKRVGATGTTLTLAAFLNLANASESKGVAPLTEQEASHILDQLENIKKLDSKDILSYEDLIAEYAKQHGETFTVSGDEDVTFGRKVNFGDSIGVRIFYKDSTTKNPEGFALRKKTVDKDGIQRDRIIIDGKAVIKGGESLIAHNNTRDGITDQVVGLVNGKMVTVYNYNHKINSTSKKMEVSVDGIRLGKDEKGKEKWFGFNLAGAEQHFVDASEYFYMTTQLAADQINQVKTSEGVVAAGENHQ